MVPNRRPPVPTPERSTKHVVFVGAYGIQNAGDDAPLLVITRGLRAAFPEIEFTFSVIARREDPLIAAAAGARFYPNPEYASREAAAGKWFRGFNYGDDRGDLERIDKLIQSADLVLGGSGNVFIDLAIDLFRGPIPLLATYCFLADLHRVPFALFGVSAGPLNTDKGAQLSGWIVRNAAQTMARDHASARLLGEVSGGEEVCVLPDPVLGLSPCADSVLHAAMKAEGVSPERSRPRLAVAVRDLDFLPFDTDVLLDALRELSSHYELLFVPQCTNPEQDDRRLAERYARELPGATCTCIQGRYAPDVLLRMYEYADVTLSVRLHGAVFSAMSGVPTVALAYLPKVRAFMESLGKSHLALDLEHLTASAIVDAVARAAREDGRGWSRSSRELGRGVDEIVSCLGAHLTTTRDANRVLSATRTFGPRPGSSSRPRDAA